jgi:hypothetical protein
MAWTPHTFKTCFALMVASMNLSVSFMHARACVVVPLLYTVCKVLVSIHVDSGTGLYLCIVYPGARALTGGELKSWMLMLSNGIGCMPDKFMYK